MSIFKVPPEALQLILELLSRKQVHQCMFVCKAWSSVAYQQFHKVMNLTDKTIYLFHPLLLERRFNQWFQGVRLVKKLKMKYGFSAIPKLEPDLYTSLLSSLPNLKVIYFTSLYQLQAGYARLLESVVDFQQCLHRIQEISIHNMIYQRYGKPHTSHEAYL